jgi:hypothetical protein
MGTRLFAVTEDGCAYPIVATAEKLTGKCGISITMIMTSVTLRPGWYARVRLRAATAPTSIGTVR